MDCPIKYTLAKKNVQKTLREEFDEAMHKTIYYYYYSHMDNKVIDGPTLRKKWGSIWYNQQSPDEIMFSHDTERSELGVKGVNMLLSFNEQVKDLPQLPIAIDHNYEIDIGKHSLSGNIEVVRETRKERTRKRYIEIIDYRTDDYLPDEFILQHDMYLTAQAYAFRKLYNAREDRIIFSFLKKNRIYYTNRPELEVKTFENVISNVTDCIEREYFYPKYSYKCKDCQYRKQCEYIR